MLKLEDCKQALHPCCKIFQLITFTYAYVAVGDDGNFLASSGGVIMAEEDKVEGFRGLRFRV